MKDGEPFDAVKYNLKPYGHSIVLEPVTNSYGGFITEIGVPYIPEPTRDRDYYIKRAIEKRNAPF
jgi:hypothetical protein